MFMVEARTVWKIKQQMKKGRYYLTNMPLNGVIIMYGRILNLTISHCIYRYYVVKKRIRVFIVELGTKVAKHYSVKLKH